MNKNIFDQYKHHENRLTHALLVTLDEDRHFLENFLRDIINKIGADKTTFPHNQAKKTVLIEQSVPDSSGVDIRQITTNEDAETSSTIPDGLIVFNDEVSPARSWALVIESKINAEHRASQLNGHLERVKKSMGRAKKICGLLITPHLKEVPYKGWKHCSWSQIYQLARQYQDNNKKIGRAWPEKLAEFMEITEVEMLAKGRLEGKITEFHGIRFKDNAYSRQEARWLMPHLIEEIRESKKIQKTFGIKDSHFPERAANSGAWATIKVESAKDHYTKQPHLTIGIGKEYTDAMLTLPDKSNKWRAFKKISMIEFLSAIDEVNDNMRSHLKGVTGWQPVCRLHQRRWPEGTRSPRALHDGELLFDLRTLSKRPYKIGREAPVYQQRLYGEMLYNLVREAEGNNQFQIGVFFHYDWCKNLKKKDSWRLIEKALISTKPFYDLLYR